MNRFTWLLGSLFVLFLAGLWVRRSSSVDQARRVVVILGGGFFALSLEMAWAFFYQGWAQSSGLVSSSLFVLSPLAVLLLPVVSLITCAISLGHPRANFTEKTASLLLLTLCGNALLLLSQDLFLLSAGWCLGLLPLFVSERSSSGRQRLPQLVALGSALCCLLAVLLLFFSSGLQAGVWNSSLSFWEEGRQAAPLASFIFFLLAVALRSGVFPFHTWLPVFAEQKGGPLFALLLAPQMGAYLYLRVILRLFPEEMEAVSPFWGTLALFCTIYGALLALVSSNARRALGWLSVSLFSVLFVGLETAHMEGQMGALLVWLSSGLSLTGFSLALSAAEVRLGPIDLRRHYGLANSAPVLGGLSLVLGFATVGLPGTIGFLAEDLIVHGTLISFPILGVLIVLATAANGYLIVKYYFQVFGGAASLSVPTQDLLPRERTALLGLTLVLIFLGLFPTVLARAQARILSGSGALTQHSLILKK